WLCLDAGSRSGAHSPRRSLAIVHLHFHSANTQSVVDSFRSLVSLVDWRRSRTGVGRISADAVFSCRNDRHHGRRIFLWRQLFQFNAVRVVILRFYTILPRPGDLRFVYLAGEDQMARLGSRCVAVRPIFPRPNVVSRGAGGGIRELSDLFWTGDHLRGAASRGSLGAPYAFCSPVSQRSRTIAQM